MLISIIERSKIENKEINDVDMIWLSEYAYSLSKIKQSIVNQLNNEAMGKTILDHLHDLLSLILLPEEDSPLFIGHCYLCGRCLEEVNDYWFQLTGTGLAAIDLMNKNLRIHQVIGEECANQLDMAVFYYCDAIPSKLDSGI